MVVGQNTSRQVFQSDKKILPYMLFVYKSHLKVAKRQKHHLYSDSYDYKYNLTKELVRENMTQMRKQVRRGIQAYELDLMYGKLAAEKEKKNQTKKNESKKK